MGFAAREYLDRERATKVRTSLNSTKDLLPADRGGKKNHVQSMNHIMTRFPVTGQARKN
jgi:hypothetical protein